jgi:uncharacterized protein (DUF736 family)
MPYEVGECEGSLFPNDRKEKPSQPDYSGRVRINGVVYRLVAWKREAKNGTTYLSLRAEVEGSRTEGAQEPRVRAQSSGGA